jgi:hypothetical protein
LLKTRNTAWSKIGEKHAELFSDILTAFIAKELPA